jgi:hypothetical protein
MTNTIVIRNAIPDALISAAIVDAREQLAQLPVPPSLPRQSFISALPLRNTCYMQAVADYFYKAVKQLTSVNHAWN